MTTAEGFTWFHSLSLASQVKGCSVVGEGISESTTADVSVNGLYTTKASHDKVAYSTVSTNHAVVNLCSLEMSPAKGVAQQAPSSGTFPCCWVPP